MRTVSEVTDFYRQTSDAALSTRCGPSSRGNCRLSTLILFLVATAVGVLLSRFLASNSSLGVACGLVAVAAALPVLAGWFLKERLRATSLAEKQLCHGVSPELEEAKIPAADDTPPGLLVVSSDLRIRFANHSYLDATFQNPEEVLGWKLDEAIPAEGLEDQARALLGRPYAATSCRFTSFPGKLPAGRRPVSITMTRIPPVKGEDRILVVVEDLRFPACQVPLVEGYIC